MTLPVTAYIGLGSNLGDREQTIRQAVEALRACEGITVCAVSRLRETAPVGGSPQPDYINAVVKVRTSLSAEKLLERLQEIEDHFGRRRAVRWGPRALDMDLLLYGEVVIDGPDLQVPHPRMHERRFVLEPLCDIAPTVRHPLLGKTAAELLAAMDSAPKQG